ncbi:DEKNAAC101637 [Brettanomyces naardenensis]|uniref:2-dehydropantolactone reductase n=1 Tax=Brettanomyces naardenensis TaxID=13370 RepID=A0A448YIP1_BRENA|nr:DEKNAAC101637 [Brettanomyces naardenensis]
MVTIATTKLNSGNTIPVLGLGFWETPSNHAAEIAYAGLKAGYRLLDSAEAYGNEEGVAKGIAQWIAEDPKKHLREDVFYTTKIRDGFHGYDATKKALQGSLDKAKPIGYIDLVLVHSPQSDYEKRHGTWKALQEAVAEGTVKNIGVSNYGIKHLKELFAYPDLKIKPVINQLELHPWLTRTELVKFTKSEGIIVEAYSPLTRAKKFDDPDLVKLGKKYGKSPAQILIRWSLDKGFIPLPKTAHKERLASNLDVFDFKLEPEEVELLSGKNEDLKFCWDPTVYPLDNEKK